MEDDDKSRRPKRGKPTHLSVVKVDHHTRGSGVYHPSVCERVIELGKEGQSLVEIAVDLGVSVSSLRYWRTHYPEFATAMEFARQCCQAWWERAGREGMYTIEEVNEDGEKRTITKTINATLWIFNMKNRFRDDWMDAKVIAGTGANGAIPVDVTHDIDIDKLTVEQRDVLKEALLAIRAQATDAEFTTE